MSDIAIRVQGLSKTYEILHRVSSSPSGSGGGGGKLRSLLGLSKGVRTVKETFWALKDVSFEVKKGEVVGIIGHNGAGKSTLLKVLSRIVEPTKGRAEIYGRVSSLLEVGTGFHGELTGRENIYLNAALLGMSGREINHKFDEIVDFSGVEQFIDTPVKKYSSGMYVRLAFSVAAHLEPDILIVDEVLSVGDASFQQKCLGKMDEVRKKGRTVLVVSHSIETIESLCQSCILLHHGEVDAEGDTKSVVAQYARKAGMLAAIQLCERKDRAGTGTIRYSKVELLNEFEEPVESVVSGRETTFRLHYEAKRPGRFMKCLALMSVHAANGAPYFVCATDVSGAGELILEGDGYIDFVVPELPLSGGTYYIALYLESGGEMFDGIGNAIRMVVINGDFYGAGCGRLTPQGWEGVGVLVKHYWRLWSDSRRLSSPRIRSNA